MNDAQRNLSFEIMNADKAWHELEARQAKEAEAAGQPIGIITDIVDVSVMPPRRSPVEFTSRDEVRDTYEGFLHDRRLRDTPSEEYIRRRLGAQLIHLDLLEGGQVDIFRHVETAMSSELRLVDEMVLDDRQTAIEGELNEHGLSFDDDPENFQERLGLAGGKRPMRRHLTSFARRTGLLAPDEKPGQSLAVPQIVEKDQSWVGYFSTYKTSGRPFTQINAHPRHGYTRGRAAAIGAHEAAGHAVDFANKRDLILGGQMDPIYGQTGIHGPENVVAEMIALAREQQILRSVTGDDAWEYHLQAEYHDYCEMVWNNALIYANTGWDEDTLVDYLQGRLLPYEKIDNIRGRVQEIRDDPAWRANTGAYEPAMRIVRSVLQLSAHQQERFLKEAGKYPYTEAQLRAKLGETAATLAVSA